MSSELHRFGIEEDQAPDARQWKMLCQLLRAIVTNPHLNIGSGQSEVVFPIAPMGKKSGSSINSHPWKVFDAGDGNAGITAGIINGYYLNYAGAAPQSHPAAGSYAPDDVVVGPGATYAGGTAAVTGTQYLYAEIPRNHTFGTSNEYAESMNPSDVDVGVELNDDIHPVITDTASIVVSSTAPDTYSPTSGKAAICIAKVTNDAGVITVDKQYLTHNPIVFLPVVDVLAVVGI